MLASSKPAPSPAPLPYLQPPRNALAAMLLVGIAHSAAAEQPISQSTYELGGYAFIRRARLGLAGSHSWNRTRRALMRFANSSFSRRAAVNVGEVRFYDAAGNLLEGRRAW